MTFATAKTRPIPKVLPVVVDHDKVVSIRNSGFPKARIERRTNRGTAYWVEESIGVPKIPAAYLDGVFYLYSDRESAEAGEKYGGTGFFVGVPCAGKPGAHFLYAVSNWHVAVQKGFSVLRVNAKEGPPEIIELGPEDWQFSR